MHGCVHAQVLQAPPHRWSVLWYRLPTHALHGPPGVPTQEARQPVCPQVCTQSRLGSSEYSCTFSVIWRSFWQQQGRAVMSLSRQAVRLQDPPHGLPAAAAGSLQLQKSRQGHPLEPPGRERSRIVARRDESPACQSLSDVSFLPSKTVFFWFSLAFKNKKKKRERVKVLIVSRTDRASHDLHDRRQHTTHPHLKPDVHPLGFRGAAGLHPPISSCGGGEMRRRIHPQGWRSTSRAPPTLLPSFLWLPPPHQSNTHRPATGNKQLLLPSPPLPTLPPPPFCMWPQTVLRWMRWWEGGVLPSVSVFSRFQTKLLSSRSWCFSADAHVGINDPNVGCSFFFFLPDWFLQMLEEPVCFGLPRVSLKAKLLLEVIRGI